MTHKRSFKGTGDFTRQQWSVEYSKEGKGCGPIDPQEFKAALVQYGVQSSEVGMGVEVRS